MAPFANPPAAVITGAVVLVLAVGGREVDGN